jgi:hypothetical protein
MAYNCFVPNQIVSRLERSRNFDGQTEVIGHHIVRSPPAVANRARDQPGLVNLEPLAQVEQSPLHSVIQTVMGPPACGHGLPPSLLFQKAVMEDPAGTGADILAAVPGVLHAIFALFGSLTGLISAHARWMEPPAGGIVVNRF